MSCLILKSPFDHKAWAQCRAVPKCWQPSARKPTCTPLSALMNHIYVVDCIFRAHLMGGSEWLRGHQYQSHSRAG